MDKYYYVISQLPLLFFDKETSMTIDYFLEEAQKWLSPRDYAWLSQVDMNDISLDKRGPRLWLQYREFEHQFRTDLALWRKSAHSGQEYKPMSFSLSLVKEGDPLAIEKRLLKRRWQYIESLEQDHHFDLELLILYYLKLQILQRLFTFDKEKGMETFQNMSKVTK